MLSRKVLHVRNHVVIASFSGGDIHNSIHFKWLADLDRLLYPHRVILHKTAGNRFYYVKLDSTLAVDKALNLMLYSFPEGEVMYHR